MEDLKEDARKLLEKVLSDNYEENILVHLVQTENLVCSYPNVPEIPTNYGYVIDSTPYYLQDKGVLSILTSNEFAIQKNYEDLEQEGQYVEACRNLLGKKWEKFTKEDGIFSQLYDFYTPKSKELKEIRGLHFVVISRKKAEEWISKQNIGEHIEIPLGRDYFYENKHLKFKLADGSVDSFDFSNSKVGYPIFETFWQLWKANSKGEYTNDEIKRKYKELFKNDLDVSRLGEIISNLRSSIINRRPLIRNRIVWLHTRKKVDGKWIFKVFPLN